MPVTRRDGKPLPPNAPKYVVKAIDMGIYAEDYKLTDALIFLSDFGEAFSPSEATRLGKDCHTPLPMRPPEAHLDPEAPLSYSADIWTLAATVYDLVGATSLWSLGSGTSDTWIAEYVDLFGPLPSPWREKWAEQEAIFFDAAGDRREPGMRLWTSLDQAFQTGTQDYRKQWDLETLDEDEQKAFLDLLRSMLRFRPEERISADGILASDWVVKWGMPDYERALEAVRAAEEKR